MPRLENSIHTVAHPASPDCRGNARERNLRLHPPPTRFRYTIGIVNNGTTTRYAIQYSPGANKEPMPIEAIRTTVYAKIQKGTIHSQLRSSSMALMAFINENDTFALITSWVWQTTSTLQQLGGFPSFQNEIVDVILCRIPT